MDAIEITEDSLVFGNENHIPAKKANISAVDDRATGMEGITITVTEAAANEMHVCNNENIYLVEYCGVMRMSTADSETAKEEFAANKTLCCSDDENSGEAEVAELVGIVNNAVVMEGIAVTMTEVAEDEIPVFGEENSQVEKADTEGIDYSITNMTAVTVKDSTNNEDKTSQIERNDIGGTQDVAANRTCVHSNEGRRDEMTKVGVTGNSADEKPAVGNKSSSQGDMVDITETENDSNGLKGITVTVIEVAASHVSGAENNHDKDVATVKAAGGGEYSDIWEDSDLTEVSNAGGRQENTANKTSVCKDDNDGLDEDACVVGTVGCRTSPEELAADESSVCIYENSRQVERFGVVDAKKVMAAEPAISNENSCKVAIAVIEVTEGNATGIEDIAVFVTDNAITKPTAFSHDIDSLVSGDDSEETKCSTIIKKVAMKKASVNVGDVSPV